MAIVRGVVLVVACALLVASGSVLARSGGYHGGGGWHGGGGHWNGGGSHWHGGVGIYVGPYWGWPYYWGWGSPYYGYPYPYAYYAPYPAYDAGSSPAMYVETQPATPQSDYWYYCTEPAGYYPYVETCSKPWRPVRPQDVTPPTSQGGAPADAGGKK